VEASTAVGSPTSSIRAVGFARALLVGTRPGPPLPLRAATRVSSTAASSSPILFPHPPPPPPPPQPLAGSPRRAETLAPPAGAPPPPRSPRPFSGPVSHGKLRRRHPAGRRGLARRRRRGGRAVLPLAQPAGGPPPHPRAGRGARDVPQRAGGGARAAGAPPPRLLLLGLLRADAAGPVGDREGVRGRVVEGRPGSGQVGVGGGGRGVGARADGQGAPQGARAEHAGPVRHRHAAQGQAQLGKLPADLEYFTVNLDVNLKNQATLPQFHHHGSKFGAKWSYQYYELAIWMGINSHLMRRFVNTYLLVWSYACLFITSKQFFYDLLQLCLRI